MRYPVELIHEDNGTVTVIVPDLPGVHSYGEDEDEALLRAVDAMETMLAAMIADREPIPAQSSAQGRPTVALPPLTAAKVGLYTAMRESRVGKAELARRVGWHLPQIDRVLDINHASRLDQIETALAALGKTLEVEVRDRAA